MLNDVLKLIKEQVVPAITDNTEISDDKKEAAIETTTHSILDGLKEQLVPGNITEMMNLFGGGNSGAKNLGSSTMQKSIESTVSSSLVSKVGLSAGVANTIAVAVVPIVMNMFAKKIDDKGSSGFNIESLIKALTGGESKDNSGGGLMGMLGGLFGGK